MSTAKVSICIASYNQAHLLKELLESIWNQNYDKSFKNLEIILLDDGSTDETHNTLSRYYNENKYNVLKYYRSESPSGSGGAFNKAISYATGSIIVLMCADDVFTDYRVISDIVNLFERDKEVGHITRFYHQFEDGDRRPVRAWRNNDPIELANNPSGLAFRKSALEYNSLKLWAGAINSFDLSKSKGELKELTNKMFIEAPFLVSSVLKDGWKWDILEYDTVAVRIHNSTARSKDYYLKHWTSSPVEEWSKIGGKNLAKDYTSLIQIKNYFVTSAVIKEIWNFIKIRPLNLIHPLFWFYSLTALLIPRAILLKIPHLYRITFGRWFTKAILRPS